MVISAIVHRPLMHVYHYFRELHRRCSANPSSKASNNILNTVAGMLASFAVNVTNHLEAAEYSIPKMRCCKYREFRMLQWPQSTIWQSKPTSAMSRCHSPRGSADVLLLSRSLPLQMAPFHFQEWHQYRLHRIWQPIFWVLNPTGSYSPSASLQRATIAHSFGCTHITSSLQPGGERRFLCRCHSSHQIHLPRDEHVN